MKILIVGSFIHEMYERALYDAFKSLGEEVYAFSWEEYNLRINQQVSMGKMINRIQDRFLLGPKIYNSNKALTSYVTKLSPDLVFIYRGTHIRPETILKIKKTGAAVFSYNNDDPFSGVPSKRYWRNYIESAKLSDHIYCYRGKNIEDFKKIGVKNCSILRSYYIDSRNYYIMSVKKDIDIIFIGHYENDGRDRAIIKLIENGIDVRIYGDNLWKNSSYYDKFSGRIYHNYLNGKEYNELINRSKIAMVFLSKINRDTYTRRCFEIPAAQTLMISEYTDELNNMFIQGVEAEYFTSDDELVDKVKSYLGNEQLRQMVTLGGYERLHSGGHEVKDRAKAIIQKYYEIRGENR